ncbi:SEC-C motif domain protein [Geotalea uraniireducens Rf4]|uniref:SEC-C motif domain protein n=1 Tax=Geotalea uraniireducens (strain Rf4) TaxID=351605 RepID=A5GF48_GEOUR|nr:SEC-C motif domain protein [Geotalea uraniireducens Rf4]
MNLASIPIEHINTRDHFVAHWALDRIKNIKERGESGADAIARVLFPELTVRSLLATFDDDILMVRLIRDLPEDLVVPHLHCLADNWVELPSLCAFPSAELLVRHLPGRAVDLFVAYLHGDTRISDRMYAILATAIDLPEPHRSGVAEAVMELAFRNGKTPSFDQLITLPVYRLAWSVDHPRCPELLSVIAKALPYGETRDIDRAILELSEIFTGEFAPCDLMTDRFEGYSVPVFSELAAFLPDASFAADLDRVVDSLGNLEHLSALEFFDRRKSDLPERAVSALEFLGEEWSGIPDLDNHDNTAALFSFFPACIAAAHWIAEPWAPAGGPDAALAYLTVDLPDIELPDGIVEMFAALPREDATSRLIESFEKYHDRYGALRIVELMGFLGYREFVPVLLKHLGSDFDRLSETITAVLIRYGETVAGDIIDALEKGPEGSFHYLVGALERIGGQSVGAYLDAHFDELVKEDKETAMNLVESVADPRFMERLKPLTGKGQELVDSAYLTLAKLHGTSSDELSALEALYNEQQREKARRREQFDAGELAASVPAMLHMEMACRACGDIARYDVGSVYITESSHKPFVADELRCIACGAEDTLDPTNLGAFCITAELMRITCIQDKREAREALDRSPLNLLPKLSVMGREMGLQEGIDLYREQIREEPGKGEHHIGLGNIYRAVKRFDGARLCYEAAVGLNPMLIEGWYGLSYLAGRDEDARRGFLALQKGVDQLPDIVWCHLNHSERRSFVSNYVGDYNDLKRFLNLPGPFIHHGMFGATQKIGRNDPCPCGSGAKYKKCCGK